MNKLVIFTDLDLCLLDNTYSYSQALESLNLLKKHNIPLVFVSSKTKAELQKINRSFPLNCSFIYENGGGAIVNSQEISFGTPYSSLVQKLKSCAAINKITIEGFHEMSVERIREATGLSHDCAQLAKLREFDEPFLIHSSFDIEKFKNSILKENLTLTQGDAFYHIKGAFNKATPLPYFREQFPTSLFVGLGSAQNDKEFLEKMDLALLMPSCPFKLSHGKLISQGPEGWNQAILELINDVM